MFRKLKPKNSEFFYVYRNYKSTIPYKNIRYLFIHVQNE